MLMLLTGPGSSASAVCRTSYETRYGSSLQKVVGPSVSTVTVGGRTDVLTGVECLAVIRLFWPFWAKLGIGGRHRMLRSECQTVPKGVSEAWSIICTLVARFVSNSAQYMHNTAELLRVLGEIMI